jgi:hypothetical protein
MGLFSQIQELLAEIQTVSISELYHMGEGGCSCNYFKLNDKFGLKCYRYEGEYENSMNDALSLAANGIGPNIYARFTVYTKDEYKIYCVVVEHVTILGTLNKKERDALKTEIKQFEEYILMWYEGEWIHDLHSYNLGVKNGKLVVIDTTI